MTARSRPATFGPVRRDDAPAPETRPGAGESKLFERLFEARTVLLHGEITTALAQAVTAQLLALSAVSDADITVFLHSEGGHVEAGDSIHDLIRYVKPRVRMLGTGWVASAGVHIFIAAEKEDRLALPNTRFLIHQPLGGVHGPATDIGIEAEEILKTRARLNRMLAERTGQPLERIDQDSERNFWMSAEEALAYGIVGRIVRSADEL